MALILGGFAIVAVHVRRHVVPPGCRDPRTLALVHQSLTERFHLPADTRIDQIQMIAGGWLAFRFECEADLEVDPAKLPPGPRPGTVHYVSQLTDNGHRLEVTVRIAPLMVWVPVQ
ncbi:MAG TPA: hypothetical protein VIZ17_04560 [Acetobacteraceae bacterium]